MTAFVPFDDDDLAALLGFIEAVEQYELLWRVVRLPAGVMLSVQVQGRIIEDVAPTLLEAVERVGDKLIALFRAAQRLDRNIPQA